MPGLIDTHQGRDPDHFSRRQTHDTRPHAAPVRPDGGCRRGLRQEGGPGGRPARGLRRPTSSSRTSRSTWSSSARPGARRTSRSGPASRATWTGSPSPRAPSSARARCSTRSTRSRSRRPSPTRRPTWRRAEARLDQKTKTDVNRLEPLAKQQAVSRQELDNALSAQDAARAQVDAAEGRGRQGDARPRLHPDHLADRRPRGHDPGARPATWSAAARARCSRRSRRSTRSCSGPGSARPSTCGSPAGPDELPRGRGGEQAPVELLLADGTTHAHTGPRRRGRARGGPDHRHPRRAVHLPQPGAAAPARPVRPRALRHRGRRRARCSSRSGRCQELQNLYSVAVVGADNKVTFRNVKVGPRVDGLWVIEEGLKPGEKVVVEGLQRLRDGTTVSPKPAAAWPPPRKAPRSPPPRRSRSWPASSSTARSWRW